MSTLLVNKQLQLTLDCPSMYPELFVCQTCKFLTMQWQFKKPFGLLIILGANQTITWITRSNSLFILHLRENHSSNEVQKAELKLSDFLNHTMFDKDHPHVQLVVNNDIPVLAIETVFLKIIENWWIKWIYFCPATNWNKKSSYYSWRTYINGIHSTLESCHRDWTAESIHGNAKIRMYGSENSWFLKLRQNGSIHARKSAGILLCWKATIKLWS